MAAILYPEHILLNNISDVTSGTLAPLAGGKIYTYEAGSMTPAETFTDSTGNTSVGVYIDLDADGRPNNGNGIWLGTTTIYKFIIKNSSGTTVQTIDNISSGGFNGSSSFVTATAESGLTSSRLLSAGSDVNLADAGAGSTLTISGKHPINSQTGTTYTALPGDRGKFITFSTQSTATLALTAAATLGDGWYCYVRNGNSGNLTIDPNGAETINGSSVGSIATGNTSLIFCTGTTFHSVGFLGTGSSVATSGGIAMLGRLLYEQVNPAQLTANTNDWGGFTSNNVVLTSNGAYDLTGILAGTFTSTQSPVYYLINSSAFTITLKHENAGSSAAARFKFSTGADIALAADQTIALIYDNTADRWRNIPV